MKDYVESGQYLKDIRADTFDCLAALETASVS